MFWIYSKFTNIDLSQEVSQNCDIPWATHWSYWHPDRAPPECAHAKWSPRAHESDCCANRWVCWSPWAWLDYYDCSHICRKMACFSVKPKFERTNHLSYGRYYVYSKCVYLINISDVSRLYRAIFFSFYKTGFCWVERRLSII